MPNRKGDPDGAARALYFPTISLTGTLGVESANLSKLFTGPEKIWSYAGSITGPIFTAGAVAGQVHQAEAGQKAALLAYQSAIQSAFADVENALVTRAKAPDQLAAQERLVTALRQYAYYARLQYDSGYAPYLTVLNAQQQLFPAELTLAQLRAVSCRPPSACTGHWAGAGSPRPRRSRSGSKITYLGAS